MRRPLTTLTCAGLWRSASTARPSSTSSPRDRAMSAASCCRRRKVSTRDIPPYRDPAVVLLDQLKEIYLDAELETVDTTQWYPKVNRRDYTVALNLTGNGIDEPDQNFYENYVCGAEGNYNKYCNPELDK